MGTAQSPAVSDTSLSCLMLEMHPSPQNKGSLSQRRNKLNKNEELTTAVQSTMSSKAKGWEVLAHRGMASKGYYDTWSCGARLCPAHAGALISGLPQGHSVKDRNFHTCVPSAIPSFHMLTTPGVCTGSEDWLMHWPYLNSTIQRN